jgi:hypothetical protein
MRITKNELSKIIKEATDPREQQFHMELESRAKIIKGLAMAGIDPNKLKDLPSAKHIMKALIDMISQAVDTTISGKAIAAQKKTSRAVKGMV